MLSFEKKNTIFSQGDSTDGLFFIQKGKVQLTVVSEAGKEATLGILSDGDFFGEGGLAGQPLRMSSAVAMTAAVIVYRPLPDSRRRSEATVGASIAGQDTLAAPREPTMLGAELRAQVPPTG